MKRATATRRAGWIALALAASGIVVAAHAAAADVVRLKNGQSLEGDVVEVNGQVQIRSAVGTIGFPAELVLRIERGDSLEQLAAKRLRELSPQDVEGRVELALELQAAGSTTLAQRVFESVLERDPDHPTARRALGYVRCDDDWTTDEECRRGRGQVLYQGRWVGSDEKAALEALDHARRQGDLERLRTEVLVESARLQAERNAAAMSYGSGGYGGYYDPYYYGGAPYYPYYPSYPIYGVDRVGDGNRGGRFPAHHGDFRGHQFNRPGGLHHQGGQPPRPLTPHINSASRPAPAQAAGRPR